MTHEPLRTRLAPCPFCGGDAKVEKWHGGKTAHVVGCSNTEGEHMCSVAPSVWGDTLESATRAWNRRAELSKPEPAEEPWRTVMREKLGDAAVKAADAESAPTPEPGDLRERVARELYREDCEQAGGPVENVKAESLLTVYGERADRILALARDSSPSALRKVFGDLLRSHSWYTAREYERDTTYNNQSAGYQEEKAAMDLFIDMYGADAFAAALHPDRRQS